MHHTNNAADATSDQNLADSFTMVSDKSTSPSSTLSSNSSKSSTAEKQEKMYGDYLWRNGCFMKSHGYNWIIGAFFVTGEMAGGGIIALPGAINRATLEYGAPLLILASILATLSAVYLGKAWIIMLRLYPTYRTHCRKPYAEMGYRACGPIAKIFVSICLNMTQFGASTCFLLLISRATSNFLLFATNIEPISYCYMIILVAVVISPILMCKSPNEFWQAIVLGMIATVVAVILISIGSYRDSPCAKIRQPTVLSVEGVLLSLGTILFTIGGHSAFPTIQHDMRRPSDFTKSAVFAFMVLTCMNLIVVFWGSLTYGNALTESITESIQTPFIQQTINVLIGLHCLMTLTLLINPFYQEMEEHMKIPQDFGWKRIVLRMFLLALLVLVATTVPKFEDILGIVGGCLLTVTSLVLPPIFYLFLAANEKRIYNSRNSINMKKLNENDIQIINDNWTPDDDDDAELYGQISMSKMVQLTDYKTLIICLTIIGTGLILGGTATVSSIKKLVQMEIVPCYVAVFDDILKQKYMPEKTITRCCGPSQSLSLYNQKCPEPNYKFYNATIF